MSFRKFIPLLFLMLLCNFSYAQLYETKSWEINEKLEIDFVSRIFTVNGVSFEMVAVKGGTFTMGCTSEQGGDCFDWESPDLRYDSLGIRVVLIP